MYQRKVISGTKRYNSAYTGECRKSGLKTGYTSVFTWLFVVVEIQKMEKHFVQVFVPDSLTFLLTGVGGLCSLLF